MPLKPRVRGRRRRRSEKTSKRTSPELLALIEQRDGIEQLLLHRAARLPIANVRALKAKHAAAARRIQQLLPTRPERTTCAQPDRDVAALVCGYPLPCPYHTGILEPDGSSRIPPALRDRAVRRIRQIGQVLQLGLAL